MAEFRAAVYSVCHNSPLFFKIEPDQSKDHGADLNMTEFIEIKCLSEKERDEVVRAVEDAIARRRKAGLLNDREIREIEEMKLRPELDIQDVQGVYRDFLYRKV